MQRLELFWGTLSCSRTRGALQGPGVEQWPLYHWSECRDTTWTAASKLRYTVQVTIQIFGVIKYYTKWCIISPNLRSTNIPIHIQEITYHTAQPYSAVGFMSSPPKAPCIRREERLLDCTAGRCSITFEWREQFISKKHGLSALRRCTLSHTWVTEGLLTLAFWLQYQEQRNGTQTGASPQQTLRNCISILYPLTRKKGGYAFGGWGVQFGPLNWPNI